MKKRVEEIGRRVVLGVCVGVMIGIVGIGGGWVMGEEVGGEEVEESVDDYWVWANGWIKVEVGSIERYESQEVCRVIGKCCDWLFYTDGDVLIKRIADQIYAMSDDDGERMRLVCLFVHNAIRYVEDAEAQGVFNYRQYPMETLVWRAGDCEDMSILCVSILRAMGYEAYALSGTTHCIAAVEWDGGVDVFGKKCMILDATSGTEGKWEWWYLPCTEGWSMIWTIGLLLILCGVMLMAYKGW